MKWQVGEHLNTKFRVAYDRQPWVRGKLNRLFSLLSQHVVQLDATATSIER